MGYPENLARIAARKLVNDRHRPIPRQLGAASRGERSLKEIAALGERERPDIPYMDGDSFRAYVQHVLAPTLRRGDVVVLDNVPAHKVTGVREAITGRRAQIFYVPPYSPDMNPIEMAFAKLKALLRQEPARTIDSLIERIGQLLDRFLPA